MPLRSRRAFDPARARRLLRLLGLSHGQFVDRLNRETGARHHVNDVSAWLGGRRSLPDAAVVLLKALVRERRGLQGRFARVLRHADPAARARVERKLRLMEDLVGLP